MRGIETVLEETALEPRESTLVAGTELQERINSLFRKQEILLHPDFLVYLSLKLEEDHGISNASNIINPDYLGEDGVIVSQDLIQAVDSIAKDVDSKGGIDPEYLSLVRMVNPESARNLVFQAKELLTNILGSTLKSEEKFLQFFVEEDLRYRKGILQGCMEGKIEEFPSNFYQEINLIVNVLKKIDEEKNRIERKSTGKKTTRKSKGVSSKEFDKTTGKSKGVSSKEFDKKLIELHEKQDLFPYNSFLEYISNKLTAYEIKRGVHSMKHKYLNKEHNVPETVMSGLESIANDIELRGGIDSSEAHIGKKVYSKRIADIMDNAERIIEGRYKKKFKYHGSRDDYFAGMVSVAWDAIKGYRLGYVEGAPYEVFEKLREFVRVLNLTGKQRKKKNIEKLRFPTKYFYDMNGESQEPEKKRKEIEQKPNDESILRIPQHSYSTNPKPPEEDNSVPKTMDGLVIYDMGLPSETYEIGKEFFHGLFGICTVQEIPDGTKMVIKTKNGEEKMLAINKKT